MAIPILRRVQVDLDCECGTTIEACDDEELYDELLEHITAAHDAGLGRDPADLVTEAWERASS